MMEASQLPVGAASATPGAVQRWMGEIHCSRTRQNGPWQLSHNGVRLATLTTIAPALLYNNGLYHQPWLS